MSLEQLRRLAENPNYQMSPKQVYQLNEERRKAYKRKRPVRATTKVEKHPTAVNKHDRRIDDEQGTQTN